MINEGGVASQTYTHNFQNYDINLPFLVPKNGIFDLFRRRSRTDKWEEEYVQIDMFGETPKNYGTEIALKNHFSIFNVYEDTRADKNNDVVYHPIQAKQHCYKNKNHGLQCRMVGASYSDDQYNGGIAYGGSETDYINPAACKSGMTAVGHMCLVLPVKEPLFQAKAQVQCADGGSTMYAPENMIQNQVMSVMLEKWVFSF